MSKKKGQSVTAVIHGIPYSVYANFKWRRFLRGFSLGVLLLVLLVVIMAFTGQLPNEMPMSLVLVLILVVLAVIAIYRSSIRQQFRKSGLNTMELTYIFDRDGWTVQRGKEQVRVPWGKTWRVRRNDRALLLYPNKRSVNIVPLQNIPQGQTEQIIAWCTGGKDAADSKQNSR